LRAVEALEHYVSATDARRLLATLATGSARPCVAANAKESLDRTGPQNCGYTSCKCPAFSTNAESRQRPEKVIGFASLSIGYSPGAQS
jgi:hypothetical protein